MAEPADSYPESATLGDEDGGAEKAEPEDLRAALAAHDEELAAAVEGTDELGDLLTTAILVAASADDEEVEHLTGRTSNLVEAVDGLATDETAALAADLGENAGELARLLETLLALQREGHLDDLIELAEPLAALEIDEDTAEGLNAVLGAVGEAGTDSGPLSLSGLVSDLRRSELRAGVGYLLSLLKALGRRVQES
jgi:uncharacterized protein YjgD (DUF1641 family)